MYASACLCVCECDCPQKTNLLELEFTGSCEPPNMDGWKPNLGLEQEQCSLLTTEPSLGAPVALPYCHNTEKQEVKPLLGLSESYRK